MRRLFFLSLVVVALHGCPCQRPENVAAKERLTKPQTKTDIPEQATEVLDVDGLVDADKMKRVVHMKGPEVQARLGSFVLQSDGTLTFSRLSTPDAGVHASEKARLVQAAEGDFSLDVTTGDGSERKLAYVNDVFFLKNGNGKWRVSRDPSGERHLYRDDSLAVWGSFYDLIAHVLVVERTGATTKNGRNVVGYSLKLPDQSAEAVAAGKEVKDAAPTMGQAAQADAGPTTASAPAAGTAADLAADAGTAVAEGDDARRTRIAERVSKWAKRSRPAGGSGTLFVDEAKGVILAVDFEGALVVGDGPDPARLTVAIHQQITEVGAPQVVHSPQDAIDEIVRKKMPAEPRQILEDAKVVAPLPRDAGPDKDSTSGKKPAAGDLPDDDDG
jgi:hypothetical protein